ncbi:flagellar hook-basal body complex protein FliE [Thermaerobacter subterraneus]|uniref:Flagellar hook-basal body complex protein FliE n=1 Tax=Thermaerobacter subterraneus DSM 13965 TaxID=867903 RepID=K6QBF9_9FIRM|nr:flagellar hook-basal body complex protein FliE [Thermaerobacter subterraneus]EKP93681.1 flagellar hook-basal body complex protein FliE [Thermaerobacter subterraneus DSM 13965]
MNPWGVQAPGNVAWPGSSPATGLGGTFGPSGRAAAAAAGDGPAAGSTGPGGVGPSFLQELARALQQLEGAAGEADAMARRLVTGQVQDLSQVMVASEKARLAIELAVQLRNKALEAYQEIMRMPV